MSKKKPTIYKVCGNCKHLCGKCKKSFALYLPTNIKNNDRKRWEEDNG